MIRYLSSGLRGPDVKVVQDALNYRRRPLDKELVPDGAFGPKTRAAVVAFQKRYGLQPDGIVGPKTRQALFPLVTFTNYVVVSRFGEYPFSEFGKTRSSNFVLASYDRQLISAAKPRLDRDQQKASIPSILRK